MQQSKKRTRRLLRLVSIALLGSSLLTPRYILAESNGLNVSENSGHYDTVAGKNAKALNKAKEILSMHSISRAYLIIELEDAGFTSSEIESALNVLNVDWKEEALKDAQQMFSSGVNHTINTIMVQLVEYNRYSQAEADYALANIGVNWNEEIIKRVDELLSSRSRAYSRKGLIHSLTSDDGYDYELAVKTVDATGRNWSEEAVKRAEQLHNHSSVKNRLSETLAKEGFTSSEIQFGMSKLEVNWKSEEEEQVRRHLSKSHIVISKESMIDFLTGYSTKPTEFNKYTREEVLEIISRVNPD